MADEPGWKRSSRENRRQRGEPVRRQGDAIVESLIVIAIVLIMIASAGPNLLRAGSEDHAVFAGRSSAKDGGRASRWSSRAGASGLQFQREDDGQGKVSETILTNR